MTEIHTYLEALMLADDSPLRLKGSQVLFTEGQPSDGRMYIVREGHLELRAGRRKLESVEPGGIVGEMALVDPAPRSATALAGPEGCVVAAVNEHTFHELVKRVPSIAVEMMRILAKRLRRTTASKQAARGARKRPAKSAKAPSRRGARRRSR